MAESLDIRELNQLIEQQSAFITNLTTGMNRVIVGQKHLIDSLLISLLSDGHILLEGVPGLAKTLAIKTLAQLVDADYSRIQFTPDLLPADVIGTLVYSQKEENFQVKKGPVFANFVLADEINRAPAKVQSALLEAMQERQTSIGGVVYPLPHPFMVLATQNPIEEEGTYVLPEAQMDRFLLKEIVDYPAPNEEFEVLNRVESGVLADRTVSSVLTTAVVAFLQGLVTRVYVDDVIKRYIVALVNATRYPAQVIGPERAGYLEYGASPRGTIALLQVAKAMAILNDRDHVVRIVRRFRSAHAGRAPRRGAEVAARTAHRHRSRELPHRHPALRTDHRHPA